MILAYMEAVVAVAFLGLASVGAGRWIAALLPESATVLDWAALLPLGGLGALGTLLFVVGQFAFSRAVIVGVLLIAAVFGIAPVAAALRAVPSLRSRDFAPRIAVALIVLVLLVTAIAGFAPITGGWENDAVAYHLLGPKVWLRDGVIRPVADNCHTAFPQILEVLFAALLAIGGERAPGLSAVLTLALLLLAAAAIARRAGLGARGGWWTAALCATMPAVYAGSHSTFVDVFYASLVLAAARIGLEAERRAAFAACGLFCGLAIGTKYTGILASAALLAVMLVLAVRGRARETAVASAEKLGIAAGVACVIGAAAYLRNWILLGSPVYPPPEFLLGAFHPKYLSAQAIHEFQAYILQRGAGLGRGPGALLRLPFQLTLHTSNFHGAGGIGLTPLALAPLGLLAARRNRFAKPLALLALLLTLEWFATQQESRFLIHVYAISAIFAVIGWRAVLAGRNRWSARLAAAVLALSVSYGCFMIVSGRQEDLHGAVSARYATKRQEQDIPFYASWAFLNRDGTVRKVLILDPSVPPYYLDKSYVKPFGQWGERTLPFATNSAEVLEHVHELGDTHVLDVNSSVQPFQVPQDFRGLTMVLDLGNQRVYRVAQ